MLSRASLTTDEQDLTNFENLSAIPEDVPAPETVAPVRSSLRQRRPSLSLVQASTNELCSDYGEPPLNSTYSINYAAMASGKRGSLKSRGSAPTALEKVSVNVAALPVASDLSESDSALLIKSVRPNTLGENNEVVFVAGYESISDTKIPYWRTGMVVPTIENDETMPKTTNLDEHVVKLFGDDSQYVVVSGDRILLFNSNLEPYQTFRSKIARFSHERCIRMAMDACRYNKIPMYFRWRKWGLSALKLANVELNVDANHIDVATVEPAVFTDAATSQETATNDFLMNTKETLIENTGPIIKVEPLDNSALPIVEPVSTIHNTKPWLTADSVSAILKAEQCQLTNSTFGVLYALFMNGKPLDPEILHSNESTNRNSPVSFTSSTPETPSEMELHLETLVNAPLFEMFKAVWENGGYDAVCKGNLWSSLDAQCNKITVKEAHNSPEYVRAFQERYKTYLLEFEKAYRAGLLCLQSKLSSPSKSMGSFITSAILRAKAAAATMELDLESVSEDDAVVNVCELTLSPNRKPRFSTTMFANEENDEVIDGAEVAIAHPKGFGIPIMATDELDDFKVLPSLGIQEGYGTQAPGMSGKTRLLLESKSSDIPCFISEALIQDGIIINAADGKEHECPLINLDTFNMILESGFHNLPKPLRRRLCALPVFPAFSQVPCEDSSDDSEFEIFKVNLSNYEKSKRKLDRLETKLSQRQLSFWNDFGFGVDYAVEPSGFAGVRNLERLKEIRRRGSYSGPPVVTERRPSRSSAPARRGRGRRKREVRAICEDEVESGAESESSLSSMSDLEEEMDTEELNARFCPHLETPEVTLQKEQELELFLLNFGPVRFFDPNDTSSTSEIDPRLLPISKIRPVVDVQELQLKALRQRHKELIMGFRNIRKELHDLKRRKKESTSNQSLQQLSYINDQNGSRVLLDYGVPSEALFSKPIHEDSLRNCTSLASSMSGLDVPSQSVKAALPFPSPPQSSSSSFLSLPSTAIFGLEETVQNMETGELV